MNRRPDEKLPPGLIPEDIRVSEEGPPEFVPTVYPPGEAPADDAQAPVAETMEAPALPEIHELAGEDAEPQIEPATRRLFFALWPGAELVQRLLSVAHPQIAALECVPVLGLDLHLTLKFLGDVTPEQREALIAMCNGLRAHAFSLRLAPLEYWSGSKSLVCVSREIAQPQAARVLVERLARESTQLGLKLSSQRWVPHVTLARQIQIPPETLKPLPKMEWKVRRLCLAESLPNPVAGQLRYRVLGRWALV